MPDLGVAPKAQANSTGQKRKLALTIDQGLEGEFEGMPERDIRTMLSSYDAENDGLPARSEEPSGDQLQAIRNSLGAAAVECMYKEHTAGFWNPCCACGARTLQTQDTTDS